MYSKINMNIPIYSPPPSPTSPGRNSRTIKCPLCASGIELRMHRGTALYICEVPCPFVAFEYHSEKDITNLKNAII